MQLLSSLVIFSGMHAYHLQCRTAKVHQFASTGNRFFMGKQTPELFLGGMKTFKNTLFLFFPRFLGGGQSPAQILLNNVSFFG